LRTAKLEKKRGVLIFILAMKKMFFLNKQLKLEQNKKKEGNDARSSTTTYLGT